MTRYIIIYDQEGNELGRNLAVYTNPQKDGDKFLNEAVFYYYQLSTVSKIEIIYTYENPDSYE